MTYDISWCSNNDNTEEQCRNCKRNPTIYFEFDYNQVLSWQEPKFNENNECQFFWDWGIKYE